ncbi:MAG: hypothetical protein GY832_24780 [Chloroflexi bacterium]|nr:hypothetical protein [Chloroflexota bacterium]
MSQDRERTQRFAYVALLLMGTVAVFALIMDVSNYIRSFESASGLALEITGFEIIDDDNPRALARFRLKNGSALDIGVERYLFELYLNGQRIGSSYSQYLGTDPNMDPKAHRKAAMIDQVLMPGQDIALEFTVYVYDTQMAIVRQAQRNGSLSWQVNAEFNTVLPYAREQNRITLRAEYEE